MPEREKGGETRSPQADNFNGSEDDIRIGSLPFFSPPLAGEEEENKTRESPRESDTRRFSSVDRNFRKRSSVPRNERRVSHNRSRVISIRSLNRKRFSTAIFRGNVLQLSVNTIHGRDLNFIDSRVAKQKLITRAYYRTLYPNWICAK